MACTQRIWTFISKDLAITRKKSFVPSSVTLWPSHLGQTDPSVLAKLNIVYSCSTACPSVAFPRRSGSEDGEHKPPPAKQPRVHADADWNQNASVFPSLIFCHSIRATLPPASAAPSSVSSSVLPLSLLQCSFIRTSSFVSGLRCSVALCPIDYPAPFVWPVDSVALGMLLLSSWLAVLHISHLLQMTDPLVIDSSLFATMTHTK